MLLLFAFSANGLALGHHGAAELAVVLAAVGGAEESAACSHDHSGADHQQTDGEGHCCHAHHSHDLQDGPGLALSLPLLSYLSESLEPVQSLPEVYLERFIPPQNLS